MGDRPKDKVPIVFAGLKSLICGLLILRLIEFIYGEALVTDYDGSNSNSSCMIGL